MIYSVNLNESDINTCTIYLSEGNREVNKKTQMKGEREALSNGGSNELFSISLNSLRIITVMNRLMPVNLAKIGAKRFNPDSPLCNPSYECLHTEARC